MSSSFSIFNRDRIIEDLKSCEFDVLVIGGGITGAGILLDAQSRGLKACLLEMQDFAEGTSSRSTKLIHGGLRYLKQREFKLVKEVGRERTIVENNAPHITYITPVLVPLYKGGSIGKFAARIGMKVYDWLAGVKKSDRHKILSVKETLLKEPMLSQQGLKGAIYYPEYRTNDARLTLEIIKKGVDLGAKALSYIKVTKFIYNDSGSIEGIEALDLINQQTVSIKSKVVINATGPWVDHLCRLDGSREKKLVLTKGVHIVLSREKLPIQEACYFDVKDGRMIFAIPHGDKSYVGTTDTVYEGDLSSPNITYSDADYIIKSLNAIYSLHLKVDDVESSWSGLRPLIKQKKKSSPSEISRKDEMFHSTSNLISIAGGKLTGYRKMAEKAVDSAMSYLESNHGTPYKNCSTDTITLSGGDFSQEYIDEINTLDCELTASQKQNLLHIYGSATKTVIEYINKELKQKESNYFELGMLMYCMEHELVSRPSDFLIRRVPFLYYNIDQLQKIKSDVIERMAELNKWNDDTLNQVKLELENNISVATQFPKDLQSQ